jgi:putative alpha-1,2-mannosidase
MAYPQVLNEFVNSSLEMHRNGGLLPRGPCGGGYTGIMTGNSITPLIVGAYMKGIRGYDVDEVFKAMVVNHRPGGMMGQQGKWSTNVDLDSYIQNGYDSGIGGAGTTLEFSFQDWCLAQMAAKLGKKPNTRSLSSGQATGRTCSIRTISSSSQRTKTENGVIPILSAGGTLLKQIHHRQHGLSHMIWPVLPY